MKHFIQENCLDKSFPPCKFTYTSVLPSVVGGAVYDVFLCLTLGSVLESPSRLDEEHRLIARYAARLAAEASNSTVSDASKGA